MDEKDLQNINQIDMECNSYDDDDSFIINSTDSDDDREVQSKTGIIINFDDDEDYRPMKKITANISNKTNTIDIHSDFSNQDFHDYNQIDMETPYGEDDDILFTKAKEVKDNPLFFNNSYNEVSGLVDEKILEQKKSKKKITFGEVEDDYWDKISKKHTKSNKKGAYNTSFHIAGNPKKEQDIFNHMMRTDSSDVDISDLIGNDSLLNTTTSSSDSFENAGFSAEGAGGGEGCSESFTNTIDYGSKLLNLFELIGFEVFKNSDNSYTAIDTCDILPSVQCTNLDDLILTLKPYINDFIIYPLQVLTAQKFTDYRDWVNWYNDSNKKQFPKCSQEIEFCDLLANHLHECLID